MKHPHGYVGGCLSLACALSTSLSMIPAHAASLTSLGHAAGAQCAASAVNDSGVAVGSCKPGNTNGPRVAWMAVAGVEVPLLPLASGRSCQARGVTNGGSVIGVCLNADNVSLGVVWNSASPTAAPLRLAPQPALLFPDVSTAVSAFTQSGYVVGRSFSGGGSATVVLWPPGIGTPVRVSSPGDNCVAVDVVDSTTPGSPAVLLNCPNGAGTSSASIARRNNALVGYVATTLKKAANAVHCVAAGLNSALQIVGSCSFRTPPLSRLALWSNPAATPDVLTLPDFTGDTAGKQSGGAFINDAGHLVYWFQTSDGRQNAGYIDPVANVPIAIPALHAGATVVAVGFGDNDLVVVVGDNATENTQAAVFNPASPAVVTSIPFIGGGANSALISVSKSGSYAVGVAEDATHNANAVITTLP